MQDTLTCLCFALACASAMLVFAHMELRWPEQSARTELIARVALPLFAAGILGWLPGALVELFPQLPLDSGWLGYALGLGAGLCVFVVQPHRVLFCAWNSPAKGIALAYYQNHLRRVAENLAGRHALELSVNGKGDGRKAKLHTTTRVVIAVALPERVSQLSMATIGALKSRRAIVEYLLSGDDGGGTRPDALYTTSRIPDKTEGAEVVLISVPTILGVVDEFIRAKLEVAGAAVDPLSKRWRLIEDRQVRLFKGELTRLMRKHRGHRVRLVFKTLEQLGVS